MSEPKIKEEIPLCDCEDVFDAKNYLLRHGCGNAWLGNNISAAEMMVAYSNLHNGDLKQKAHDAKQELKMLRHMVWLSSSKEMCHREESGACLVHMFPDLEPKDPCPGGELAEVARIQDKKMNEWEIK